MAEKEYIEREALIKACKKIIHDRWNETTAPVSWSHAYADFIDDINEQPAADVAPVRHGRWVKEKKDVLIHWHCSACRECYFLEEPNAKYCPHCGARMGGDPDANGNDNKTPET